MFNIIERANQMLNSVPISREEILFEYMVQYKVDKGHLPSTDDLLVFTGDVPEKDEIYISISDGVSTVNAGAVAWIEEYENFVDGLYENDEITVDIRVKKKIANDTLNVYCLENFSEFISGRSYIQLFEIFTELFQVCEEKIAFHLLDTNGSLRTRNMVFTDNDDFEWTVRTPRSEQLKNCEDASVFLDRAKFPLVPQDFTIVGPIEGGFFQTVKEMLDKLRRILSFVYLSNSAYITSDRLLLQFNPTSSSEEYGFDELTSNKTIPEIFDWVFKDDSCVDKASIARKIINVYCHDKQAILNIDDKVFNAVRSDYVIYQKNHVEQYIDMKNRISEHIVESAKQLQELSHEVADAFRNNFVAVIVFILTVLLTDSIDFSQFLSKEVSPNVTAVCGVFTVGSALYLVATIVMGNTKWKWIDESYNSLKKNYEGTLDERDIEDAFSHDDPIKTVKKQFNGFRRWMVILWVLMIIGMGVFTLVLHKNHVEPQPTTDVVETIVSSAEESEDPTIEETTDEVLQTPEVSNAGE